MPFDSQTLIVLTIAYGVVSSVTTFDIRLVQAKKNGTLPSDEPDLPKWVAILFWIEWIIFSVMIYLNWKYSLLIFAIKFVLKVLPVLETIGNILMSPFKVKKN